MCGVGGNVTQISSAEAVDRDVVVVLNYFGRADTLACLESLAHHASETVVVVVDNGSFDGTLNAVRQRWPGVVTLQTGQNLGFAGGMNVGLRWALQAGASTITMLNNDTIVTDGALGELIRLARDGYLVSPQVRYQSEPSRIWFGGGTIDPETFLARHMSDSELAATQSTVEEGVRPSQVLNGCCLTAASDVWDMLGGFDERFFLDFEDSDLSLRARKLGVHLAVAENAVIYHRVSASFTRAYSYLGAFYYVRNGLLFARLHNPGGYRARLRFVRQHALPVLGTDVRERQWPLVGRHGLVLTLAAGEYLTRRFGRAPRWLERRAERWARTPPARRDRAIGAGRKTKHGGAKRSSRQLSVVVLDHTALLGGAELALIRLLDALPHDIAVRVILFSDGPLVRLLRDRHHDVEVITLAPRVAEAKRDATGFLEFVCSLPTLLRHTGRLAHRIGELRPDLIYTTSLKSDLIGVPVSWLARRPLVWHVHDRISSDYLPTPMVRIVRRLAATVPAAVLVNSQATAATLPGARHLVTAYPGYSPTQQLPDPTDRRTPSSPVVGIIGRLSPTKGQLEFVQAAARVREHCPAARFHIIGEAMFGDEPYAARVRREVDHLGLGDVVEFTGFMPDTAAALDELSVLVHASGTPEPFGQVIVEAMIRGVPLVATRGGGVAEIVQPDPQAEPLGLLVPPHDVSALAAAVRHVLDDPETAQHRAQAAWLSATTRFPISRTADQVVQVWRHAAHVR